MQSVFVIVTEWIASKNYFWIIVFCANFGRDGKVPGKQLQNSQKTAKTVSKQLFWGCFGSFPAAFRLSCRHFARDLLGTLSSCFVAVFSASSKTRNRKKTHKFFQRKLFGQRTEQVKTGQVNPDRPLVGPSVDTFMGCFVGSLWRAENREISPRGCSRGSSRGRTRGATRGPTRGATRGPTRGSRFAFACSVRGPCLAPTTRSGHHSFFSFHGRMVHWFPLHSWVFFRNKKARFGHSHIHLAIVLAIHIFTWQSRANASLIHSIHANRFTPFTRIMATRPPPPQNPPFWAPPKKKLLPHFRRKIAKKGPHKLFRGNFGAKNRVPNGPFWATKSLVYFPPLIWAHPNLHSPIWVGQTAVIPNGRVQIWVCLFLYGWYYPSMRLQIWVRLICVCVCDTPVLFTSPLPLSWDF